MEQYEVSPANVASTRRWSLLAVVAAALVLGITAGVFKFQSSGSAAASPVTTFRILKRVGRILYITALSSTIAGLGDPKLKSNASVLMFWECADVQELGLEDSAWSILPVTLCLISVVATWTNRNHLAAWSIALAGAVLAILFAHTWLT